MHIVMETVYQKVKQSLLNTLLCWDAVYCKSCICQVQTKKLFPLPFNTSSANLIIHFRADKTACFTATLFQWIETLHGILCWFFHIVWLIPISVVHTVIFRRYYFPRGVLFVCNPPSNVGFKCHLFYVMVRVIQLQVNGFSTQKNIVWSP